MEQGQFYILNEDSKRKSQCNGQYLFLIETSDDSGKFCEVYSSKLKHSVEVQIAEEYYWIRFSVFITLSWEEVTETDIYLEAPDEVIDKIYHNNERWVEKKRLKKARKNAKSHSKDDWAFEKARYYREGISDTYKKPAEVPSSVSWNASHPYQGGGVSPK